MRRRLKCVFLFCAVAAVLCSCLGKELPPQGGGLIPEEQVSDLEKLAAVLADAALDSLAVREVQAAVGESFGDGYDEEYLMTNAVYAPGRGTSFRAARSGRSASGALYEGMFRAVTGRGGPALAYTRSDEQARSFLDSLASTDIQVYWPYVDRWDGHSVPVVTFDHGEDRDWNYGYIMRADAGGGRYLSRVLVDEDYARSNPVWVVNMNKDRDMVPLGEGTPPAVEVPATRRGDIIYTLVLRSFTALKNYDCWLAGASEFFVKVGAVESFDAATEAEMALFSPTVTDFYIVVRRREVGTPKDINTIIVSDWTLQMSSIAFMIVEDDGGKQTKWDSEIMVKVNSKSYGITVSIPLNSKDDIVWRGSLSSRYLFATDASHTKFSDVMLDLEIVETYDNSDW